MIAAAIQQQTARKLRITSRNYVKFASQDKHVLLSLSRPCFKLFQETACSTALHTLRRNLSVQCDALQQSAADAQQASIESIWHKRSPGLALWRTSAPQRRMQAISGVVSRTDQGSPVCLVQRESGETEPAKAETSRSRRWTLVKRHLVSLVSACYASKLFLKGGRLSSYQPIVVVKKSLLTRRAYRLGSSIHWTEPNSHLCSTCIMHALLGGTGRDI
jgi:hypothetical protein